MHLLLEGSDLQELLAEVRGTHGEAARVVRAERIRSGGVAGFFSKERYEVTVEMDGEGTNPDPAPAPVAEAGEEEREALDFEALLAAADAAESRPAETETAAPETPATPEPAAAQPEEDFEAARQGLLEMLRASTGTGTGTGTDDQESPFKVSDADAEMVSVIAQTGDSTEVETPEVEARDGYDEAHHEATAQFEAELLEQARLEIDEAERIAAQQIAAQHEADRALEEERMRQQEIERHHAREAARREAAREQELRREEARADVRRRQSERMTRPAETPQNARSLGEVLAATDAAEGTHRLEAMFAAGRSQAPQRTAAPQRPHRPISTESDSFAATMASMRSSASDVRGAAGEGQRYGRTPATGVTADVRSVTTQPARPARPRSGRPAVEASTRNVRSSEDRVSDQFGAANGTANGVANGAARGPARRPELRRPAPVSDQFGDQFGDRFAERAVEDRRGDWAGEYDQPAGQDSAQGFEQAYQQEFAGQYAPEQDERAPRPVERTYQPTSARDGDENEAMSMDLTYREPVTTYSDRPASSRMTYREPQDTGDVLRLARDIEVPAPLRVGAGELVVVIGEADAVVSAALLVADEVGSEAPLVLGRADVQNTVTADELPARQDQARRWSAPLTVAIPARPTGADAERAARMAAEIGAAAVVVCVDATRRSHAVASLLRALEAVGLPARRVAVHRAAESPDPLDVLSLDVPVGFLDGRPATSGAWAGLLLDAAGDHGMR
jgi:flagellar biosynthesis GTPase FlhF